MIGMIIPRTMCQHRVGPPPADLLDDFVPGIQRWSQLAVSIREHFSLGDSEPVSRFLGLVFAECGGRRGGMQVMTRIAVRYGEKLDGMAKRRELRGCAPEPDLAIIGMRPNTNDPHV